MNCEEDMKIAYGRYSEPLCCLLVCFVRRLKEAKLRIWMEKMTYSDARCKVVRPVTQEPYGTSSHSIRTDNPFHLSPYLSCMKGPLQVFRCLHVRLGIACLVKRNMYSGSYFPLSYMLNSGVRDRRPDKLVLLTFGPVGWLFSVTALCKSTAEWQSTAARERERAEVPYRYSYSVRQISVCYCCAKFRLVASLRRPTKRESQTWHLALWRGVTNSGLVMDISCRLIIWSSNEMELCWKLHSADEPKGDACRWKHTCLRNQRQWNVD
jgi:hypothetical protein